MLWGRGGFWVGVVLRIDFCLNSRYSPSGVRYIPTGRTETYLRDYRRSEMADLTEMTIPHRILNSASFTKRKATDRGLAMDHIISDTTGRQQIISDSTYQFVYSKLIFPTTLSRADYHVDEFRTDYHVDELRI